MCDKGHAFTGFLQSILDGIIQPINIAYPYADFYSWLKSSENRKLAYSSINTNSITRYTSVLMDKIHIQNNLELGFLIDFDSRYFLYNKVNPQDTYEDIISKVIPDSKPEFIWQVYLMANANKVLTEANVFIAYYVDLLCFYSAETLNTYVWQPDINEVIRPKVFLHDNYAKVECCWFEEYDTAKVESPYGCCRGLYIDTCEYEIQNNAIRLINRTEQQLIKSWYDEDEINEDEEDLPF